MKNVTTGAAAWRFEPPGINFKKNLPIQILFDREFLKSKAAMSNLFMYFYNERSGKWERLTRVKVVKIEYCFKFDGILP